VKDLLAAGQHDSPIPMFTLLDLEGGYVDRLEKYLGWRLSATQMAQAAVKDPTVPEQQGAKTAHDLASFGFNLDLAPDVDVQLHYSDILYARSFGSTPDVVTADAGGWLQGLQGAGVLGCIKHFPGIGDIGAHDNPHDILPTINRTKDQLEATELAPFRALIQSGQAQCIMSTDVLIPSLDPKLPSEISKATITGVLRTELGYKGIAVTDALYMAGILDTWTFTQASVMAIEAGNDMVMAPWTPTMVKGIVNGLKAALSSGALTQAQVDASVQRILALKIRYHILTPPGASPSSGTPTTPATTPTAHTP
jgi:beta-N-acetylhexosaminidase